MNVKRIFCMAVLMLVMTFGFCGCGSDVETDTSPVSSEEISELYTNPDAFKGRTFEFTAQVFDVEKDGGTLYLQAYQDIENYDNNTVVVYENADIKLKDEDFIRVKGTVEGEFSGENYFGTSIALPTITAQKVELIEATDAFPAEKTVEVDKTVKKGNYEATVSKVDFTENETRIYLTVSNNGSSTFDNYPDMGVIVQGGKQFEANWNEYYPEPSTELKPGATSESVISFKGVNEEDFTYSFEGYNSNYDELEFVFDIKVE